MGGFESTATGVITFDPPLTVAELLSVSGSVATGPGQQMALCVPPNPSDLDLILIVDDPAGEASASKLTVGNPDEAWNRRHIHEQLVDFVARFGEGRTFTGAIEERSDGGDPWAHRYEVVDGEVRTTEAIEGPDGLLVWPADPYPHAGRTGWERPGWWLVPSPKRTYGPGQRFDVLGPSGEEFGEIIVITQNGALKWIVADVIRNAEHDTIDAAVEVLLAQYWEDRSQGST